MIQFTKLRLYGFKSFVDRTEFDIGPGLTGIVGPNGCGKSNLVEALRWSMGESSTKRMRGGSRSMEDVIFSGTSDRPARNAAEVSVVLDNTTHSAPAPYSSIEDIEVVRKIERDHGSAYRINGKNVRARDVQLLYADILSGANSPYLVSQGRVTQLIQAKPIDRRMVLEEAAGITGLYARRHEAELRLRATDNNIKRVDDLLGNMEDRLAQLKKQARQAHRYRNLSAQIRQLEISVACLEWHNDFNKLQNIETTLTEAESKVADKLTVVTQLTKTQTEQSKDLPSLRQKDAELAAALQNLNLALQRLEDEQARLSDQRDEAKGQLNQLYTDREHEQQTLNENSLVLERLEIEEKTIKEKEISGENVLEDKQRSLNTLKADVGETDQRLTGLMETTAENRAQKQSLEQQVLKDNERIEDLSTKLEQTRELLKQKQALNQDNQVTVDLKHSIDLKNQKLTSNFDEISELELLIQTQRAKQEEIRAAFTEQDKVKSKFETEINTLNSILNPQTQSEFKPVFDDIKTEKGFETALSRALGDLLMGSTDDNAPIVWKTRDLAKLELSPLPEGCQNLEPHISAPAALKLALSQIGYVEEDRSGAELAALLKPGQSIVSHEGSYWRWDGLVIKSQATDSHAQQLKHKNKLADLEKQLPDCLQRCESLSLDLEKVNSDIEEKANYLEKLQGTKTELATSIHELQETLNDTIEQQADHQAELAKLEESLSLCEDDKDLLEQNVKDHAKQLSQFDDGALEKQQHEIEHIRKNLHLKREELQTVIKDVEIARQDQNRRKARMRAIGDERINLQNRCIRAKERLKELDQREEQLKTRLESLKKRPSEIKEETESLLSKITDLDKEKSDISSKLNLCENELDQTTKALKEAESKLSDEKELRAHSLATVEERREHLTSSRNYIQETFEMSPEELSAEAALDPENMPDITGLKENKDKLTRSRDMIGPVNLRAEQEADTLDKELSGILLEKNDLVEAVDELRQGINKLNKEARERLQLAFNQVNEHFRAMFSQLFDGGKAHLALIESDDPLEAGLEIFAQPPGKALQSLSLLSGGEQTLTAIALIFAMFLTNPAPICVLDEVDAPLDDANVDRFCDLLEEFAEKGETRFMVITHHRLTMARMDRLYGVTMSEKGVSKLVSVDLHEQLDFLDAAE